MVKLFLVRHGETAWNKFYRYQGHTDVPLSEEGFRQAQLVAGRLKAKPLTAVYASDLSRARQTAEIIAAGHGLTVITDPALREVDYGLWEGLTLAEINAKYPGLRDKWLADPENMAVPGGESLGAVRDRAVAFIEKIRPQHPDGNVVAVTHGGLIAMLLLTYLNEDVNFLRKFFARNTNVSRIDFADSGVKVVYWGDASHLDDME
jgi:alpha-ribazole phosphatase